jgi:hypothetical protein
MRDYIKSISQLAPLDVLGDIGDPVFYLAHDGGAFPRPYLEPLDMTQDVDWDAFRKTIDWVMRRSMEKTAKPWVVAHGDSRKGKTRAMIMAATLMCNDQNGLAGYYKFLRAVDFANAARTPKGNPFALTGCANEDYDAEYAKDDPEYAKTVFNCGVVFDDLDKMQMSANVISELFAFIDHAEQHGRSILFSTQVVGHQLKSMMLGNDPDAQRIARVESILNRIKDHSETIHFT